MFSHILVAVDGSNAARMALSCAIREADAHGAALHVVYVVQTGFWTAGSVQDSADEANQQAYESAVMTLKREAESVTRAAIESAEEAGVTATASVRFGHPGEQIITAAQEAGADLLVIGSRGMGAAERFILGSVSSFVVAHSPISAMVVPFRDE